MCTLSRTTIDSACRLVEDCGMNSSSSPITPKMSQQDYNILTRLPGNRSCIDCGNTDDAMWASVSFGLVLCTKCSQEHKSLLFAKNIQTDEWTSEELLHMKLGGNERFRAYLDMRDVDLAATPLQQRYTCQAAKDYQKSLQEMVQEEVAFDESMNGSMVFEKPGLEKPASEEQDSGFLFRAINNLVKPSETRSRTSTEDSISVEEVEQADQEEEEEVIYPQQEDNIISRFISRQPVTSLDASASKIVRQCLEENKDNQSILYKWTAANMIPTVSHMGRKYQVEDEKPTTTTTVQPTAAEQEASFVARMGLSYSWHNGSDHNNNCSDDESDSPSQQEYKEYLRELSDSDFSKLKAAMRQKGVRTNLCLDLLYSVAKSSCSHLPEPKKRTLEQAAAAGGDSVRSRWELLQGANASTSERRGEGDEEDMPSHIIISRCA